MLYVAIASRSFRRYSTYRVATAASVLENTFVSMLRGFVLLAVVDARGGVRGLSPAGAMTFAFVAGAIQSALWIVVPLDIGERIRSGDVVTDLYRPVDFQGWWFASEAGRAGFNILGRGLPPLLIGSIAFDLVGPSSAGSVGVFALSVALAFVLVFAWKFLLSLSGFWLFDTRGVHSLAGIFVMALSGAMLPLAMFPTGVGRILRWLPFASMVQTPFEAFVNGGHALPRVTVQAAWAVAFLLLGRVVLRRAVARMVVQGG